MVVAGGSRWLGIWHASMTAEETGCLGRRWLPHPDPPHALIAALTAGEGEVALSYTIEL